MAQTFLFAFYDLFYKKEGVNMSVQLLDRTRKISQLLHNNTSYVVVFSDICKCVGDILDANVLVVSAKGKVLGIYEKEGLPLLHDMLTENVGEVIDTNLNERFLSVLSTKENVNLLTLGFDNNDFSAIILPIDFAGERLGSTFIYRPKNDFLVEDIILSEYVNTVIELEMMRAIYEEDTERKRNKDMVKSAMDSLSVSEKEAIRFVFTELGKKQGNLVASKVAAKNNITRSIIVNAIKKLESAGVIEARSQGMKGTYIKILNDAVFDFDSVDNKDEK